MSLRDAARQALAGLPPAATEPRGVVSRFVLDVDVGGRRELVSVSWDGADLRWSATGGDGASAHVRVALAWLAGESAAEDGSVQLAAKPVAEASSPGVVGTPLADALEALVTAVLRAGTRDAKSSLTVDDAWAHVEEAAGKPLTPHVSRWMGRLRRALDHGDETVALRLLEGAARAAEDLSRVHDDREAARRLELWRGPGIASGEGTARMVDRTLVEVARESVFGADLQAIVRRYLVCLRTGEVFREDGPRADGVLSVGPCPRRLHVGLADVEGAAVPRALRVLQYTVSPELTEEDWLRVQRAASSRFERVVQDYKRAVRENPAFAEPFALLAPASIDRGQGTMLVDHDGFVIPVARAGDPAAFRVFDELASAGGVAWVAGRLFDAGAQFMFIPLSVGVVRGGRTQHRRVA